MRAEVYGMANSVSSSATSRGAAPEIDETLSTLGM